MSKGYVYILKDEHFKRGVKIGRAIDVEKRIRPMLTANPWLSVYVKIRTSKWIELEGAVHDIIKLVSKKKQVKNSEFFVLEPEKAKEILLRFKPLLAHDFEMLSGNTTGFKNMTQLGNYILALAGKAGKTNGYVMNILRKRNPCPKSSKWRKTFDRVGVKFDAKDFVRDWTCAKSEAIIGKRKAE